MTFEQLGVAAPISRALHAKGYTTPTPIQTQTIPVALQGRDILGIAQTGTGKTAAFAIPLIQQLLDAPKSRTRHIRVLILTPTRELAIQTDDCLRDYTRHTDLLHTVIFGGVKQGPQVQALQRGVDLLVATPGRLLDLLQQKLISIDSVAHFVLDEADRMLDMGFIHDIKRLLPLLPKSRQTLFFSATMPPNIVQLTRQMLHRPVRIEIAPQSSVVESVEQGLYFVDKPRKAQLLVSLLQTEATLPPTIVFSRTKHGADKIARVLNKQGIACHAIHGNKSQTARQKALTDFKSGKTRVIIATDIAARGIDINHLARVINYDLPEVPETYVHRIGRTGRAGRTGSALSFCSAEERHLLKPIKALMGNRLRTLPLQPNV